MSLSRFTNHKGLNSSTHNFYEGVKMLQMATMENGSWLARNIIDSVIAVYKNGWLSILLNL